MTIRPSAIVALVGVAAALLQSPTVSTQSGNPVPVYFVTDLGTLGGAESVASTINYAGLVAGSAQRSDSTTHAFFYDGAAMHDLGTIGGPSSAAWGISYYAQVVGQSLTAVLNTKGFIYGAGVRRSMGTFGGSNSAAYGTNLDGDVVGAASTTNNLATRAFLYRNGIMKSLGTLGGANSVATAINDLGEIAGFSNPTIGSDLTHAFLYRNGVMADIGTLGTESDAWALNNDAAVVGRSMLASGETHAFLYRGGVMTDIGTLGGHNSVAKSITDLSQIVGESDVAGASGTHAFLYENGVMSDLNTRLPPGSGWVLESANAISNPLGEIAGVGTINGQRHAFLLTLPVRMTVRNIGIAEGDSNLPHDGVEVGRAIDFGTTVSLVDDRIAHNVVLTDTISGPATVVSAQTARGFPCSVAGNVATCQMTQLGQAGNSVSDEAVNVTVRVTGPGVFSHTVRATAANSIPNPPTDGSPSTDTLSEENIGIALKTFTLSATTVAGGTPVSARAELTSLASPNGSVVHLASSNPAIAPVPSPFVVQRPTAVRTFNIVPPVVSEPTTVTISATYGRVTISQTLTVLPPALKTLSLTRSTMIGSCQTATAKLTLTGIAPASGAVVALSSTTAGVHIPATITVTPGDTTATLTVSADAVQARTEGLFTATFGGVTKQLPLAVRPILLTAVTLTPPTVSGGTASSGAATIECAAPPGGLSASLLSTNPSAATPTMGLASFAAGSTIASFAVQSHPVAVVTTPSIRVTVNGVTKSAPLTVQP